MTYNKQPLEIVLLQPKSAGAEETLEHILGTKSPRSPLHILVLEDVTTQSRPVALCSYCCMILMFEWMEGMKSFCVSCSLFATEWMREKKQSEIQGHSECFHFLKPYKYKS